MANDIGPYKYQRLRHRLGEYPRPPQPAYQPNQLPAPQGWGMTTGGYWSSVLKDYMNRRRLSQSTALKLGGI